MAVATISAARSGRSWLLPFLVLAGAVFAASQLYAHFRTMDRALWYSSSHDRNAHYAFALTLASDLKQGHVLEFLKDVNSSQVWGPLYGTITGLTLLVGGFD